MCKRSIKLKIKCIKCEQAVVAHSFPSLVRIVLKSSIRYVSDRFIICILILYNIKMNFNNILIYCAVIALKIQRGKIVKSQVIIRSAFLSNNDDAPLCSFSDEDIVISMYCLWIF